MRRPCDYDGPNSLPAESRLQFRRGARWCLVIEEMDLADQGGHGGLNLQESTRVE